MVFNGFVLPGVKYTTDQGEVPEVNLSIGSFDGVSGAFCDSLRDAHGSSVVIINGEERTALQRLLETYHANDDKEAFDEACAAFLGKLHMK